MSHHVLAVGKGTRWVREQRGPFVSFDEAKAARQELRVLFEGLPAELGYGRARSLAEQHDFEIISAGGQEQRPW